MLQSAATKRSAYSIASTAKLTSAATKNRLVFVTAGRTTSVHEKIREDRRRRQTTSAAPQHENIEQDSANRRRQRAACFDAGTSDITSGGTAVTAPSEFSRRPVDAGGSDNDDRDVERETERAVSEV